ncbi:hypothetical protein [Nostocoides vanveenii]|uniref:Histidine kinase/HSP90-like ATPase domain-containing protein n=1 Tax=Nostocoides vanveenii TaxID=330835 RepID=A0ABP4W6S0_9MICO
MRHARATCAEVDLAQTADEIRITLRDNGIGQAEPHEGFGIRSLRERAMALGGDFASGAARSAPLDDREERRGGWLVTSRVQFVPVDRAPQSS